MQCWARALVWLTLVTLGTCPLLSACGHKGDLYLPTTGTQGREQPPKDAQP